MFTSHVLVDMPTILVTNIASLYICIAVQLCNAREISFFSSLSLHVFVSQWVTNWHYNKKWGRTMPPCCGISDNNVVLGTIVSRGWQLMLQRCHGCMKKTTLLWMLPKQDLIVNYAIVGAENRTSTLSFAINDEVWNLQQSSMVSELLEWGVW